MRPGHPQEFDQWRWAGIDELVRLIVPFKRAVYEQVVRDFAALARPEAGLNLTAAILRPHKRFGVTNRANH